MRIRKRYLPPGWYPGSADQTREAIGRMESSLAPHASDGVAGIVPHAGWEFSGGVAFEVLSRISRSMDTIVIIGGHLGPADGILCAFDEAYETPLGPLPADLALLEEIRREMPVREDRYADNTVEVQLPFIRYLFPSARVLGMRASPSLVAEGLGAMLAAAARKLGRSIGVVGSTDLTHYGTTYGFSPAGSGEKALRWVRETNDRRFIECLLTMDSQGALDRALRERSACSAGGALVAMSFARANGIRKGGLVRYATSLEVHRSDSFVGYAGILYAGKGRDLPAEHS
jgi:AmmeMemoRadiSam system protein B